MSKIFTITKESELEEVTQEIIENLSHNVILLKGEMGTGKTTFTKYFIKNLTGDESVTSPTFSLINEYKNMDGDPIFHMDLYRLENLEEALNIGIEEYLDAGKLTLIEWPQLIEPILPPLYHEIEFQLIEPNTRSISFL